MIAKNEREMEYIDMTPDIKSDTFVNDDYKGVVLSNAGCYIESKNKIMLRERIEERLSLNDN